MKKIILHPPREERPKMWRSLGELENTPDFQEWLHQEFPRGADVYEDSGYSRRDFMKLLGASMALAGVGLTGCRRPEAYLVPFTKAAEFTIPGKNLYYATSMPTRLGAMPLIATTVDGRPVKLEGNPLHPGSNGRTDGFAQASVLDLYDPHRSKTVLHQGAPSTSEAFAEFLAEVRKKHTGNGQGLAFLVQADNSPTRERLRRELEQTFPGMTWAEYEPLGQSLFQEALRASYGPGIAVVPNFEAADRILALDSDFLNCGETGIGFARGFSARRNPKQDGAEMNRLYVVESSYSLTGGMADHRLAVPAFRIGAVAAVLAQQVLKSTGDAGLRAALEAFKAPQADVDSAWIEACAKDLSTHLGGSLVLVGPGQPLAVQVLVLAINEALGAKGHTLSFLKAPAVEPPASIQDIDTRIADRRIETLFILGGNPAYNAPANFNFAKLLTRIPTTVHHGLFEDETSKLCTWHVPAAHYLESWSDGRTPDGTLTPVQPMILPLWNGLPELEIYQALLGHPAPEGPALVKETFAALTGLSGDALSLAWNEFLRQGFLPDSAFPKADPAFQSDAAAKAIRSNPLPAIEGDELVFLQSSSLDDGRYANNSWLQETPDFVTKITWDNALLVSTTDAERLGIKDGDVVTVSAGDHSMRTAVVLAPGQAAGSFAIALGYGRQDVSALMENVGFDAYPLRVSDSPRFRTGISIQPTGEKYTLARPQEHQSMEGRDLFREGPLEVFEKHPSFPMDMSEFSHLTPLVKEGHQLFTNDFLTAKEQWAMAIDLNVCTGCNACLLACRAENNVPVVGKDQVRRGRDMAWIRIDRWFAGEPDAPEMLPQAILCQQCENAPCETVCPVNATVHSEDGLNLMAYNRCIGTRYCANNCPWKVRRFNFFDYNERPIDELYWGPLAKKGMAESLKMVKNPNVTVRMRGVMEKCTFCIQRIEEAKISRLVQAGPRDKNEVPVGPFQVACQQVCPADAITFGNQNDPESAVAKMRNDERGYTMFTYVNARPRVTYLARIKNPNPEMPGAELVGKINSNWHGSHGGSHGDSHNGHPGGDHSDIPTGATHGAETHAG